jgi:hypothetical protein
LRPHQVEALEFLRTQLRTARAPPVRRCVAVFSSLIVLRQFVEGYVEPLLDGGGLICGLKVVALCSKAPSAISRFTTGD